MRRALGPCVCLLFACSSDDGPETKAPIPAPVTFVSGSRLRAKFQEVDGVRVFKLWMDTKLGKECSFHAGRCLADTLLESARRPTFEDPACGVRIVSSQAPISAIFVEDTGQGCAGGTLHAVGERITPAQLYRRDASGACVAEGESGTADGHVRLGPAFAPEAEPFVRAREENDPSGGRIVMRWRVADDGARELIGAWDTERNEPVARPYDTSGKRWYPQRRATPVGEACAGIATSRECEPNVVFTSPGACRPPELYALGPAVDATTCSAGPGYQILSAIPTQQFAEATSVDVGAGRVRLRMDARGDGTPLVPRGFFDTEARVSCGPGFIVDSGPCTPAPDTRASEAFADAQCTEPAMAWNPAAANCDDEPVVPRYVAINRAGPAVPMEVGAQIASAFRKGGSGECIPYDASSEVTFHRTTPLDPARLPIVTSKTE